MGLSQSKELKEKIKRKNDIPVSEEETPNVLCKRIKLSDPETQDTVRDREPSRRSTEDEEEIVNLKEKLSIANKYIEGEIIICKKYS